MNTLITSQKQKNYILAATVAALVFCFFPAIRAPIVGSVSLAYGGDGMLTLIGLALVIGVLFFQKEITNSIE